MAQLPHLQSPTHLHTRQVADRAIARYITSRFSDYSTPVIIAIGGPGGSGKTTFAKKLQTQLGDCGVIHLDNYKTSRAEREQRGLAGPHPDANRIDLALAHLSKVKEGCTIHLPLYDNKSGDTGSYEEYPPHRITIIEGEISTYAPFRHLIDLSLFIDSDFRTQLAARTGRDVEVRGHSLKKAFTTFLSSNLTEFTNHGAESKAWADIQLFCHEDYHFSIESVKSGMCSEFQKATDDGTVIAPTGLIVPVATPFETDFSLCQPAYIDHLSWLSAQGVSRILAGGTTAEFFSMTTEERLTLLKLGREYFPGFIMFNISAESLAATIELAQRASRYGADALICLPPYYYAGAPAEGLIRYFSLVAEACDRPLYLYNFPKHTGNPLTADILKNVPHAGIKDSSADLSLIPHTKAFLLGGDSKIIEAYRAGACGFIPGLPNVFPKAYLQLENALSAGDTTKAEEIIAAIGSFKATLPKVSGIVVIKEYLHQLIDAYPVTVRPPLCSTGRGIIATTTRIVVD